MMGKLERHCAADTTARCIELIRRREARVATITSDNGTEFHGYKDVEAATGVEFYFANPTPLLGARDQREHQRSDQAVPAQEEKHGSCDPAALRRGRRQAQLTTEEATGISDPRRSAMYKRGRRERRLRKCCVSNWKSGLKRTPPLSVTPQRRSVLTRTEPQAG